jgi:hypothetical protein
VVDPIEFVGARLPSTRTDSTWARPYRLWGESAGIPLASVRPDERVMQGEWWCALAAALTLEDSTLVRLPETARERMIAAGVALRTSDPSQLLEWKDVLEDLEQVPEDLWRLPHGPVHEEEHERTHEERVPRKSKGDDVLRHAPPTRADLCLVLAGCARKPPKPQRSIAGEP